MALTVPRETAGCVEMGQRDCENIGRRSISVRRRKPVETHPALARAGQLKVVKLWVVARESSVCLSVCG